MTNEERRKAIYDRMDRILEAVPDNPVYEEHEARSVASYLQCIKLLKEMESKHSNIQKQEQTTDSEVPFNTRLRIAMAEAQFTQKALSEETGINTSTLSLYVTGKVTPEITNLTLLQKALDPYLNDIQTCILPQKRHSSMSIDTQKIRTIMALHGITFNEFAKRYGASRQAVSLLMKRGMIHPNNIKRLAQALGVSPEDVLLDDEMIRKEK